MCGICGKMSLGGCSEQELKRMTSILAHRGPDDHGYYIDENIGLGHRRLSIIDLDGGRQPISNEDGSLWIVFNGEIYNYLEIKKKLEKKHIFKTKSDTEVVLHLYEEYGVNCLEHLRGMFAFAIYDRPNRKVFLARDHLGQKPLFYYHNNDEFAFASEIKSLLAFKPGLRELNHDALCEYLTLRIITAPRSMFRQIKKLPAGHCLTYQNKKIQVSRYWHLEYEPKAEGDLAELVEELDHRLEATVKYHLVSDVPIGAFLSGGMDSSLIVAMMSKLGCRNFETFSGDIHYKNFSESSDAKLVANKYHTKHNELCITPSLLEKLPTLVWHLDEPSDPLSICMYDIAELASSKVKVVLGGDGGDELFGGYDRYYGNIYAGYYSLLPEVIRKKLIGKLLKILPEGFWYKSISHKLKWIHQMSFVTGGKRYAKSLSYFYFSDEHKKKLFTNSFRSKTLTFDPEACLDLYFSSANIQDVIDKMLYTDSMSRMTDHPVMIQDRMTMAHGLEARSPFLDHKLAEFCAKIPTRFKVHNRQLRYIQVELAKKYLPKDLIDKKKQGFASAFPYLLEKQYAKLYKKLLLDASLVKEGYLEPQAISNLLQEHLDKKVDHGNRLWLLCNAEIWHRMFIENQSLDEVKALLCK